MLPLMDLICGLLGFVMVAVTIALHYEILRIAWSHYRKWDYILHRRAIGLLVFLVFLAHTISVWFYGAMYWVLVEYFDGVGSLLGGDGTFMSYVYFSVATYSSLGFGDVVPQGAIRMIAGIEVINGLLLIGWSVSITYLAMEKFWDKNVE